jgi:hypothetical protein
MAARLQPRFQQRDVSRATDTVSALDHYEFATVFVELGVREWRTVGDAFLNWTLTACSQDES